jgi:DNA-binding transcriptional MerR regulator
MEEPWTILELAELAADALAATEAPAATQPGESSPASPSPFTGAGTPSGPARANGRVRDVPNERLVRWYVTVGLVDPPLSRRGRVARYGRRHLLQLVAVKRRQAEGRSLAEIQAELAGATDETLAAVARVPDTRPETEAAAAAPARFWARHSVPAAERPGLQAPAADHPGPPVVPAAAGSDSAGRYGASLPAGLVRGVRLAPGVTLLLEGADREPSPDDVIAIADAAQPLLGELASRGLPAIGRAFRPMPRTSHLE